MHELRKKAKNCIDYFICF